MGGGSSSTQGRFCRAASRPLAGRRPARSRIGRRVEAGDVPEIARQLARIADALERLAPHTTTEPAEGEDRSGSGRR
jgi:hypothetical protein